MLFYFSAARNNNPGPTTGHHLELRNLAASFSSLSASLRYPQFLGQTISLNSPGLHTKPHRGITAQRPSIIQCPLEVGGFPWRLTPPAEKADRAQLAAQLHLRRAQPGVLRLSISGNAFGLATFLDDSNRSPKTNAGLRDALAPFAGRNSYNFTLPAFLLLQAAAGLFLLLLLRETGEPCFRAHDSAVRGISARAPRPLGLGRLGPKTLSFGSTLLVFVPRLRGSNPIARPFAHVRALRNPAFPGVDQCWVPGWDGAFALTGERVVPLPSGGCLRRRVPHPRLASCSTTQSLDPSRSEGSRHLHRDFARSPCVASTLWSCM